MTEQAPWTPAVIERWQAWRNEDQADNAVISRSDIITLLSEIERLRAALDGLLTEARCFAVDPPSAALDRAIEEAGRALEPKP